MKTLRTRKKKNGSLGITVDMTEEERSHLIYEGLRAFVEQENFKVIVLKVFPGEPRVASKKIELSENEAKFLIELGFNRILKRYIESECSREVQK